MGCDIHAYVEIKIHGKWQLYSQPRIKRDYDLFGKMAGVRNEFEIPIAKPRGLPKNVSEIVKLESDFDGSDGHSHSWLNRKEIMALIEWSEDPMFCHDNLGYMNGNYITSLNDGETDHPEEYDDVRLVFWFDN